MGSASCDPSESPLDSPALIFVKSKPKAKPIHVLIACGGTGGHLFPGIAVAEVLTARGHKVTLLISEKKIDAIAASGHKNLHFEKMPFLAMPKPWSPKMIGFLSSLWKGMRKCRGIIRNTQVDVVLGMGGFTSFAPLYAGRREKCRTLIHESNAIPGKANRLNSKFADIALCGLEACKQHFSNHHDVRYVGTPVRSCMRQGSKEDAHSFFRLDPKKKTLLIMGGSQGARGINRIVGMTLDQFEKMGIQVLHIAGPADYEEVRDSYAKHPLLAQHVAAFCHRMDLAYKVADLAIARSGASSMSELAYFGVPSLLIPYPFAADDHQSRNAEIFDKIGASKILLESNLNAESLAEAVSSILTKPKQSEGMKRAANQIAVRNSAERIADLIVQEARKPVK